MLYYGHQLVSNPSSCNFANLMLGMVCWLLIFWFTYFKLCKETVCESIRGARQKLLYRYRGSLRIFDTGSCRTDSRVLQTDLGCSTHRFRIPGSLHGLNKAPSCLYLNTGRWAELKHLLSSYRMYSAWRRDMDNTQQKLGLETVHHLAEKQQPR